jgi:hypothetical protein
VLLAIASCVLSLVAHPRVWGSTNFALCPPAGQMGGSTAGFVGSVAHGCNEGGLTTHQRVRGRQQMIAFDKIFDFGSL